MATSLSAEERSFRARIGAHALHATHGPIETTAVARAAFLARFEHEVDPDHLLPDAERKRRAEHARRAHFTRLAFASVRARREKREAGVEGSTSDAS